MMGMLTLMPICMYACMFTDWQEALDAFSVTWEYFLEHVINLC